MEPSENRVYKPSDKERKIFGEFIVDTWAGNYVHERRSSMLREWYRKGQQAFRALSKTGSTMNLDHMNDLLTELKETEREGFLMGWQSDAWATKNDQPLAVEGAPHWEPQEYRPRWTS